MTDLKINQEQKNKRIYNELWRTIVRTGLLDGVLLSVLTPVGTPQRERCETNNEET